MFRKEDIHELIRRRPFAPFVMLLSSGDRITVNHPELVFVGPRKVHVVFLRGEDFESSWSIALAHVAKIEEADVPVTRGTND